MIGYAAQVQLLRAVASKFLKTIRNPDTFARLGGDEFALLLLDVPKKPDCADLLSRRLQEPAQDTHLSDGHCVKVNACIVLAWRFPLHGGDDTEAVLQNADHVIHQAKQAGNSCYRVAQH